MSSEEPSEPKVKDKLIKGRNIGLRTQGVSKSPTNKRNSGESSPYSQNNGGSFKSLNNNSPSNNSLNQKESAKKFHYLNYTGPGDYEPVPMTGTALHDSGKKNQPSFSFGTKITKPPIISKKHIQDIIGIDSPGVGTYDTSPDSLNGKSTQSPKYTIGTEERFAEKTSVLNLKKQVPHSYLKTVGNLTLTNWNGGKLSKEKRFIKDNPFYKNTISPGPGIYNLQEQASLSVSNSKTALNTSMKSKQSNLFGNTYDKYKNVYYSELSRDFQNREGPGPGYYRNEVVPLIHNKNYSFPKEDRKMTLNAKKNSSPDPASYKYEDGEKKVRATQSNIKFGTSRRDFDFTKFSSQNAAMISKGLH